MGQFGERLAEVVKRKGPLCVGLDPRWESLPDCYRRLDPEFPWLPQVAEHVRRFCVHVLELTSPYSGIVKLQAAFFELFGPPGLAAMQQLIHHARELGWLTILDAKRGDVPSTAAAYAQAAFTGCSINGQIFPIWNADALTVNPYLGDDALTPFIEAASTQGRGVFVLVRTSNPGAGCFQDLCCDGKPLYVHVAKVVERWNEPTVGPSGLGDIGAVVGATHPRELAELRRTFPRMWFLVPGYGAQGATAVEIRQTAFRTDGLGVIVNSSRSLVFPFHPDDPNWEQAIQSAALHARNDLIG
ncbi:MAG: orotidine-5'-phosphate decarboxylase [Gemmataceae bacterium]|nr:orotidine-5'-phosphate decarboxylase [Gemmataceae bacterium]MCS7271409.1 orotidine-5'-phosphate decarboxylase [Gemmataceae bacterium]MDW8244550.1 orotidine-5'-phosphate decarboxylase [Thermogemmata sp.]